MTAPTVEELLARAVLARPLPSYTTAELEAAERRIAARIAAAGQECAARRPEPLPGSVGGQLATLCRTVVDKDGALEHMGALVGGRIPQPEGARVLGCVLQLAGREDSARFWWQFAAGAGDAPAAYCLYLHHLALGEEWEAELWRRQADPEHTPGFPPDGEPADGSDPALVLRVLALLHGDHSCLTDAAAAAVDSVPDAVQFVDEIELPLPCADFAQRIERLTDRSVA
ncbi:hypothetical protein [Streptomyces sp. RFCAC02]|uniref:hypothetical protein n=1 Tax=Streptomyces sp. RFCAC02 TaxID=2499143 RepID=UPI00101ED082|nr:hypothetical protein [Streptomyces sp. RFCAC02]